MCTCMYLCFYNYVHVCVHLSACVFVCVSKIAFTTCIVISGLKSKAYFILGVLLLATNRDAQIMVCVRARTYGHVCMRVH